jgi:hypothetical protein
MIAGKRCAWLDPAGNDLRDFQAIALQALSRSIDRIGPSQRLNDRVAQFLIGPLKQGDRPEPRKQVLLCLQGQAFESRHIRLDEGDVAPGRLKHPADFGTGRIRVLKMLHHADGDDQIEAVVRERQLLGSCHRTFSR